MKATHCAWCGNELPVKTGRGRPRSTCDADCYQEVHNRRRRQAIEGQRDVFEQLPPAASHGRPTSPRAKLQERRRRRLVIVDGDQAEVSP